MYFFHVLLDYNLFEMNISYSFGHIKAINLLCQQPSAQLIVTLTILHVNSLTSLKYPRLTMYKIQPLTTWGICKKHRLPGIPFNGSLSHI